MFAASMIYLDLFQKMELSSVLVISINISIHIISHEYPKTHWHSMQDGVPKVAKLPTKWLCGRCYYDVNESFNAL